MKKLVLSLVVMVNYCLIPALAFSPDLTPNGGNMNFYPMMQRQMERQETLDFVNNAEDYKAKRAAKEAQLDQLQKQGKRNQYLRPTSFNLDSTQNTPSSPANMQFTKDENGQIRIQGIK